MRRIAAVIALVVASASLPATAAADHPQFHGFDELQDEVEAWEEQGVEVEVPAQSLEGRDIYLTKIGDGPVEILYLNALHANEPSGTEAYIRLVWSLLGDQGPTFANEHLPSISSSDDVFQTLAEPDNRSRLLERVTILGFPMLDPDGVERGHMRNTLTNLDYTTKATPQSQAIAAVVQEHQPELILDSHGGPNEPAINVGMTQPFPTDEQTLADSLDAADTIWRSASQVGAGVDWFREGAFDTLFGLDGEPFDSADGAYWDAASKAAPLTQESYIKKGIPAVLTETVGLQSSEPVITISEGASVQQVTMAAVALERSGMLDGTSPREQVLSPGEATLSLDPDTEDLRVRVAWQAPGQDATIELRNPEGEVVARTGPSMDEAAEKPRKLPRESRVLAVDGPLTGGEYTVSIDTRFPQPLDAYAQATWYTPAEEPAIDGTVLDPDAEPALDPSRDSVWGQLSPFG